MLAGAVALREPDGTIREWVGSVADIHDRKQAEERLRESEERLRLALHAGRMFAWEQDLRTDYVTRSQNAVSPLGIASSSSAEFLDKAHPEDRVLRQHFAQVVKTHGSYTSKAQGRNRVRTDSPAIRRETEKRVSLGAELREGLAQNQIAPYYQPKICLATGRIVGFEAPAR